MSHFINADLKKFSADANSNSDIAKDAQEKTLALQEPATNGAFDTAAKRVADLAARINNDGAEYDQEKQQTPPPELLQEFDKLARGVNVAVDAVEAILLFIQYRFPQLKGEDNNGVEVQVTVAKKLEEFLALLEGGASEKGSGRFVSLKGKSAYLKSRSELEKVFRAPSAAVATAAAEDDAASKKKDAEVPTASTKLLIKQLDLDAATDISRTWAVLKRVGVQVSLLVARNFGALNQPRREGANGLIG